MRNFQQQGFNASTLFCIRATQHMALVLHVFNDRQTLQGAENHSTLTSISIRKKNSKSNDLLKEKSQSYNV